MWTPTSCTEHLSNINGSKNYCLKCPNWFSKANLELSQKQFGFLKQFGENPGLLSTRHSIEQSKIFSSSSSDQELSRISITSYRRLIKSLSSGNGCSRYSWLRFAGQVFLSCFGHTFSVKRYQSLVHLSALSVEVLIIVFNLAMYIRTMYIINWRGQGWIHGPEVVVWTTQTQHR